MPRSYTVRIRMGAAYWDITARTDSYPLRIDLRKLDKAGQRKAIFELVKYTRLVREAA